MNLRELHLNSTQIRDLAPLAGLKKLGVLTIGGTQVSDEQAESLRQALPNCIVDRLRVNSRGCRNQ